jgi:hypothetical protein
MTHVHFSLASLALVACLFLGMLLFLEIGRRIGLRRTAKHGAAARVGVGVVDSAVYAVLALLLGFTFAGATTRFDQRRDLIVTQGSAISTAWQRLDALPAERREPIRVRFRAYVDNLLDSYLRPGDLGSAKAEQQMRALAASQKELWSHAVAACLAPGGEPARMLVLPALNEMFDAVDREYLARKMHPPLVIWIMLGIAALAASLFAGFSMASGPTRNWLFTIGIAATISIVTWVIIDLEYPRLGIVRIDPFDRTLVELRGTLN